VANQADEVVLVDNGSEDGAVAQVARRHGARLLRLPRNAGFAGGADAGLKGASGDVVAVLNDDAIAGPGWLASAEEELRDPNVASVGPKIVLEGHFAELVFDDEPWLAEGDPRPLGRQLSAVGLGDEDVLERLIGGVHRVESLGDRRWRWSAGRAPIYLKLDEGDTRPILVDGTEVEPARLVTVLNSAGGYLRPDGYTGDCGDSIADEGQFDGRRECFALTGAALVTTADTIGRVGGIARHFFNYYEDTDWCWRARLAGMRHVYQPAATVVHVRGQTSGGTAGQGVQYFAERNRLLCLLRNAPLELATRECWRKRTGGGDDGVAERMWRFAPAGVAGRLANRRRWELSPREVFEGWAGVDAPTP
jgi:hypothetical protein